jgi:hypothetical protein
MVNSYVLHEEIVVNYGNGPWMYVKCILYSFAIIIFVSKYFFFITLIL